MADSKILFDMARKGGNSCWSPNVWKSTRYSYHFEGFDTDP